MVQLKPEIYRLIIKALISSDDGVNANANALPAKCSKPQRALLAPIHRSRQATLVSLMQVSKTFYEICKTELYDDCLVGDLDTFVQDISSNPHKVNLLGRVQTLRLYQGDPTSLKEPTYLQLIADAEWPFLVAKFEGNDFWRSYETAIRYEEFADRFFSGPAVRALQSAGGASPTLSQLQRVTMSAEDGYTFWGLSQFEIDTFAKHFGPPPVPLYLIDLPRVDHYCQRLPIGPLALPHHVIKVANPPAIVTIHTPDMLNENGLAWLPPIVLGTTNRYMIRCANHLLCSNQAGEDKLATRVPKVLHILKYLLADRPVLHINSDNQFELLPFSSFSLDNTRIEIYDYIRYFKFDSIMNPFPKSNDSPLDLAPIQSIFNENIGRWKGKVFLKNRNECPPCSACGFEGEWKSNDGENSVTGVTSHFVE